MARGLFLRQERFDGDSVLTLFRASEQHEQQVLVIAADEKTRQALKYPKDTLWEGGQRWEEQRRSVLNHLNLFAGNQEVSKQPI